MPKRKPKPVVIVTNPEEIYNPANDALINPQADNVNYEAVNFDPSIGWVAPLPLKELIRRNKEKRHNQA